MHIRGNQFVEEAIAAVADDDNDDHNSLQLKWLLWGKHITFISCFLCRMKWMISFIWIVANVMYVFQWKKAI